MNTKKDQFTETTVDSLQPPSPSDVRKWASRTFEILAPLWEEGLDDGCKDFSTWLRKDFWKAGNTLDAAVSYFVANPDGNTPSTADKFIRKSINFFDLTPYPTGHWRDDWGWWGNAFLNAVENASRLVLKEATKNACLERARIAWEVLMLSARASATYTDLYPDQVPPYVGGGYSAWNNGNLAEYLSDAAHYEATPNTVTNLGFLALSLRLASAVPAESGRYLEAAGRTIGWFHSFLGSDVSPPNVLFNSAGLLRETANPHVHPEWCSEDRDRAWSADQGAALYCFCLSALILKDEPQKQAAKLRDLLIEGLKKALPTSGEGKMRTKEGVFVEYPSPTDAKNNHCNYNDNYSTGPGVFMRYVARGSSLWDTNTVLAPCIKTVLKASAEAAWNNRIQKPKPDENLVADSVRLWDRPDIPKETYGQYYNAWSSLWPFLFQTDALDLFTAYLTLNPK